MPASINPEPATSALASNAGSERATDNSNLFPGRRDWKITALVVLLILTATVVIHRHLMDTAPPPLQIVFREGSVILTENDAVRLLTELENRFVEQSEYLSAGMHEWQETSIDAIRDSFLSASSGFLDWYFSPIGSYTRLGATLWGDLDKLVQDQLEELFTGQIELDAQWQSLMNEHGALAQAAQQEWLTTTLSEQYQWAAEQTQVSTDDPNGPEYVVLNLSLAADTAWINYTDNPRWSMATGAGGTYAATKISSRLLQSTAMRGALNALRSLAARFGIHLARSTMLGATAGVASGPGVVATAPATFVGSLAIAGGTEYALLKLEERQHRPAMEEDFELLWTDIEDSLRNQFQEHLNARATELQKQLRLATQHQNTQLPTTYRILGG